MTLVVALIGSILMFIGWVLAIVPAFHHFKSIALVVVVAIVAFGLAIIPAGLDIFVPSQKRGAATIIFSLIPAIIIFLVAAFVLPIGGIARLLAIISELAGMALYGWTWHTAQGGVRT